MRTRVNGGSCSAFHCPLAAATGRCSLPGVAAVPRLRSGLPPTSTSSVRSRGAAPRVRPVPGPHRLMAPRPIHVRVGVCFIFLVCRIKYNTISSRQCTHLTHTSLVIHPSPHDGDPVTQLELSRTPGLNTAASLPSLRSSAISTSLPRARPQASCLTSRPPLLSAHAPSARPAAPGPATR